MLEYKKERTVFPEEMHALAKEMTEAINAYINETKGDELKESLDVAMAVAKFLIGSESKEDRVNRLISSLMLVGINAGRASME